MTTRIIHLIGATVLFTVAMADTSSAGTAGTESYTYDALGRLTAVAYPDKTTVNYSYDAAGNRLQVQGIDSSPPTAPGAPTYTDITGTSAMANWTAATDSIGIASYEFRVNSGTWTNVGNTLGVELGGLTSAVTYSVQVHAKDTFGTIGPASTSSFATVDTIPPSAPGTPTFTNISGTTATVSWTAATDNVAVASYEYQLNTTSGTWTNVGTALSAGLSGLAPATKYTLYIHAKDAAGNIGPVSSGSFTTVDTIPPSAPGAPTFSGIAATTTTASWTAASDAAGVSSYAYQLNTTSGAWTNVGAALSVGLSGLTPATSYTLYVHAIDTVGNIGAASSGSFKTLSQVSDTLPWTNGSTLSFCGGQYANTNATYSFTIGGGSEIVTVSPSNSIYTVTNTGWTSGTTLSAGTYSTKVAGTFSPDGSSPITITFAGTGHTSTATVYTYEKATCP